MPRSIQQTVIASALVFVALVEGCATRAQQPPAEQASIAPDDTAAQRIAKLAHQEELRSTKQTTPPMPPGVEPAVLVQRDLQDPKSRMSLEQAVADVSRFAAEINPSPAPAVDEEAREQALKLYVKGRSEMLENLHLQATIDLQKALELDPASPEILRALAKCFVAQNRTTQAVELYERLLGLAPDDSEALFTVGLSAANRRDFIRAARMLGRFRNEGQARHDPAADILADYTLSIAFRELAYDRASIQAATSAIHVSQQLDGPSEHRARLESVYRQRAEIWRSIGDAHCRLGEFQLALVAYAQSADLPTADASTLHPRIIFANLSLGRVHAAQHHMLQFLTSSDGGPSERDVRLCAFLAAHGKPVELLAEAVASLSRSQPGNSGLVRAAASLLPPQDALQLLMQYVNQRPRDLDGVSELLAWQSQSDLASAVALAMSLAVNHPDLANAYADRLAAAAVDQGDLLQAVRSAERTAGQALIEARLLAKAEGYGEAWQVCRAARERFPEDRGLMMQELQLAAAMQEPGLFQRSLGTMPKLEDAAWFIGLSQAYRSLAQTAQALEFAREAVEGEPDNIDAMVELARAAHAHASVLSPSAADTRQQRNASIEEAIRYAELIISIDPQREESHEILVMIYGPGGVQADSNSYRQTRERLSRERPQSSLNQKLAAQDAIAQKRYEQALDRLLNLYDAKPSDQTSLTLAITAWQQWGKLDTAEQWLNQQLMQRPGDSGLLQQWVRVQLLGGNAEAALTTLEEAAKAHPENLVTRRLLESVYRATGQIDAARELGEQRLLARPQGVRREIELAALYAGAELATRAFDRLDWIRAHAHDASADDLVSAIGITGRLRGDAIRRDQLTLELVRVCIDRFPNSTLQHVYGPGLRSLARLNQIDDEFNRLAQLALAQAPGAREGNAAGAAMWGELAQALVDDEQPESASRALRVRLQAALKPAPTALETQQSEANETPSAQAPLDRESLAILARMTFAADAAAASRAGALDDQAIARQVKFAEDSISLVNDLLDTGVIRAAFNLSSRAKEQEAYYEVSVMYSLLGADIGAGRLLEHVIQLDPKNAMARNNLGYMLLENGSQDPKMISEIEQAYALLPGDSNILDTLGWLRYKQGLFGNDHDANPEGGAASLIELAAQKSVEPSPEVYDHLGDVRWRQGKTEEAVKAWRQAERALSGYEFQQQRMQQFQVVQSRLWSLLVEDPRVMYDREYGRLLEAIQQKLAAVEQGSQPKVASTFAEMLQRSSE